MKVSGGSPRNSVVEETSQTSESPGRAAFALGCWRVFPEGSISCPPHRGGAGAPEKGPDPNIWGLS